MDDLANLFCLDVPDHLAAGVPADRRAAVADWWRRLDDAARSELARDAGDRGDARIELRGVFVDPEDARESAMWREALIEHVNAHPEIEDFFADRRSYRICRAHAEARRVLETGVVPASFRCPLVRASCPFASAVARGGGRALALVAVRSKPPRGN